MLNNILRTIERFIPKKLYRLGQPVYHYKLSLLGALVYGFPSRKIKIVGVTGTKGKSTTVEFVNAILETQGEKTALLSTIRFKIGDETRPNLYKMSMPGRFFVQKFIRDAVRAGCTWVILEMTSEGTKQFRHKWIALDALIFTNLAPEHIESHGSYENYRAAKLKIAKLLRPSLFLSKKNAVIIANADDAESTRFLEIGAPRALPYSLDLGKPFAKTIDGYAFTFENTHMETHIPGIFNLANALGAAVFARSQRIPLSATKRGIEGLTAVRGRVEYVREGQAFDVVVDYAHTPDSLESFYTVFKDSENICILGNTGGGRDTWKRPKMAHIAEMNATHIILTNEDPYDESPEAIVNQMAEGVSDQTKLSIILDRREAIRSALEMAHERTNRTGGKRVAVLITGKGTDPFIMGAHGSKTPWDDATVVREELKKLLSGKVKA